MGYLENQLNILAKAVGPIGSGKRKLALKDIRGDNNLKRAWKFLTEGHGKDLSAIKAHWDFLACAYLVRNKVLHAGHRVHQSESKLQKHVSEDDNLDLNMQNEIVIETYYLLRVLESVRVTLLYAHIQFGHLSWEHVNDLGLGSAGS